MVAMVVEWRAYSKKVVSREWLTWGGGAQECRCYTAAAAAAEAMAATVAKPTTSTAVADGGGDDDNRHHHKDAHNGPQIPPTRKDAIRRKVQIPEPVSTLAHQCQRQKV